jgi:hypothetical protein
MGFDLFLGLLGILIIAFLWTLNLCFSFLTVSRNLKLNLHNLKDAQQYYSDVLQNLTFELQPSLYTSTLLPLIQDLRTSLKTENEQLIQTKFLALEDFYKTKLDFKHSKLAKEDFAEASLKIPELVHKYNEMILTFQAKLKNPLFKIFNKLVLRIDQNDYSLLHS